MRILLTTHQLADFAGSEVYTYELAKALHQAGNQVTVYSRYIDKFESLFAREGIRLVADLSLVSHEQFDVAHVHHHINALEVRSVFPNLPIFFLSHGSQSFLENPPEIEVNITKYGAISELVRKNLRSHGIPAGKVSLVHNIVNEAVFAPGKPIHTLPKRALIISNRMDEKTEQTIKKACAKLGIELTCIGSRFKKVRNEALPRYINKADIVFTIGRGVIETMMCGRVPVVLDHRGGDGLMTPENYERMSKVHFSGLFHAKKYTVASLVKELRSYDAALGEQLRSIAVENHGTLACVRAMIEIYNETIRNYKNVSIDKELLGYIVQTVHTTRTYNFSRTEHRGVRQFLYDANSILFSPMYRHTLGS